MNFYHPHFKFYSPTWKRLSTVFGIPLPLDRTGITDFGFEYSILDPIPTDPTTSLTFNEICNIRALQIAQYSNNPVLVMWSGGIDSTAVFSSFLNLGIKFTVGYTDNSIAEYPWLYNQIKNNEWQHVDLMYIADKDVATLQQQYHIVTGVHGDQIVGTANHFNIDSKLNNTSIRSNQMDPYQDVLPPYLVDFFSEQIAAFPIEIKDFADFLWWFNFTFKYQWVQLGFVNNMNFDVTQRNSYSHFFNNIAFQQWAMSNRDANKEFIVANDTTGYKTEFKKYILDILGDKEYFNNKLKVMSLNADTFNTTFNPDLVIINDNGNMKIRKIDYEV